MNSNSSGRSSSGDQGNSSSRSSERSGNRGKKPSGGRSSGSRDQRDSRGRDSRGRDSRGGDKRDSRDSRGRDSRGGDKRDSRGSRGRDSRGGDKRDSRGYDKRDSRGRDARSHGSRDDRDESQDRPERPYLPVDQDITGEELDKSTRLDLRSLPVSLAEKVSRHLVMVGRYLETDPAKALTHAKRAHELAPRILVTRETMAMAAYRNQDYKLALREARTVKRMSGAAAWLPIIADCERGLGKPQAALDLINDYDWRKEADETRAEADMVAAGACADLDDIQAALGQFNQQLLRERTPSVWSARYRYAYSEFLRAADQEDEADRWLQLAAASDPDGSSGAEERLMELTQS